MVALALMSTSLELTQVWKLSSLVYVSLGSIVLAVLIWDSRRVYATGIREQHISVTILCWLIGGSALLVNVFNLITEEPRFLWLYTGLVNIAVTGLLLFIQNLILLSNDPSKS